MKKLVCIILILSMMITIGPAAAAYTTKYKSLTSEKYLWDTLFHITQSPIVTSAILAMYWRESFFRSDIIGGEHLIYADLSTEFTEKLDLGITKNDFISVVQFEYGGYGLAQWCTQDNLNRLYDYAIEWGGSFGNAKMQCYFTVEDLKNNFSDIWEVLNATKDPYEAGRIIAIYYEGTSEGVEYVCKISNFFYQNYLNNIFLLPEE